MNGDRSRPLRVQAVITGMACGGAERQMAMLTSGLAERGHDVRLAVLHGRDSFFELDPRVEVRYFERDTGPPSAKVARAGTRWRWLRARLAGQPLDVVVSFIDVANVWALAAAPRGTPVVVSERVHPPSHRVPPYVAVGRRWLYPRARALVMQTDAGAAWARSVVAADRIQVIPNAVLPPTPVNDMSRAARASTEREILAVGRLERQKGFDLLLRAFATVATSHPEWNLRIAGEGPERGRLEALVSDLGLDDRVQLPGVVPDIATAMRSADLFVLSSRYEGFPNALCEAMAHGLPVIATDCPVGPREILRDGVDGVLVPAGDRAALAAAMDRMMGDPVLRDRFGRPAIEIANRLSPARIVDQWEELVSEVAERSGS